jgi:hypothetical protein
MTFLWPYSSDQYRADYMNIRVDHHFSNRNDFYAGFSQRYSPYALAGNWPLLGWTRNRHHMSIVANDTFTISPTMVLDLRFGGILDRVNDGGENHGFQPLNGKDVVSTIGLLGVNPQNLSAMGFPSMSISGYSPLTVSPAGTQSINTLSYAGSLTWVNSRHTWKTGAELRTFSRFDAAVPTGSYGSFTFTGNLSGNPYADFLLGLPTQSTRLDPLTNRTNRAYELGLFVEDAFKITPNLTFTYGLRWDYFGAAQYSDKLQYNWDPKTGAVIVSPDTLAKVRPNYPDNIQVIGGNPIQSPERTNFAPRLGVAYQFTDKTVLRGAYGVFTESVGSYANANGTGPFQISETYLNAIQNGAALLSFPNPYLPISGAAPSQSVVGYTPTASNGYIQQFNVALERQVKDVGLRVLYGGTRARGLNYPLNLNLPAASAIPFSASRRPFPQFVNTTMTETDGRTNYDALTIEAMRRAGSITFDAFWTLEHNMSDYLNLQDPYNHKLWNRTPYSPNQIATIKAAWQLPVGRGQRYLSNAPTLINGFLGGWQAYFMCYFQTGQFFSPTYSGADPANVGITTGYPDRVANGNLPTGQRSLSSWFDTSAFALPAQGHFGNSGVNILEGPGFSAQHVSIVKDFSIYERLKLQFTLAVSNVFNHPNFLPPSGNISVPQGNVITSDVGPYSQLKGGPRSMEARIRLSF